MYLAGLFCISRDKGGCFMNTIELLDALQLKAKKDPEVEMNGKLQGTEMY